MANLVDLKRKTEEKIEGQTELCCGDKEDYPYGLQIRLDNETIEKLGIPLPEVGKEVTIMAKAKVTGAGERSVDGNAERNAELQITEMAITKPTGEVDANKLYPTMAPGSAIRTEESATVTE